MKGLDVARWTALFAAVVGCADAQSDESVPPLSDAGTSLDLGVIAPDAATTSPPSDASSFIDTGSESACDPVLQNCPRPSEKCSVDFGPPQCAATAPSDRGLGQPCTPGACERGLACVLATETSTQAHCEVVCNLATGVGCARVGPDFECLDRIENTDWGACRELQPMCDPATQAPCTPSQACQPFLRRTGAWEFRCRVAGTGLAGDPCDGDNPSCVRGLACVSNRTGTAFCRLICQDNEDCMEPQQCVGIVDEPPFLFCTE